MRNKIIFTILIITIIFEGCSFVYKQNLLKSDSISGDWEKQQPYYGNRDEYSIFSQEYYWSSYKIGKISLYVTPIGKEESCILFGLPYLPIFPNIFHFRQMQASKRLKYFYVDVLIKSIDPDTKIDLSKISFDINEKRVKPRAIFINMDTPKLSKDTTSSDKYFCGFWADSISYRERYSYCLWLDQIERDTIEMEGMFIAIQFEFSELNCDVDKIEIKFNDIFVNDPEITVPEILFYFKSHYLYSPFEAG